MGSRARTLLVALALCAAGCGGRPDPGPPPPDVVLILVDTLRADALPAYGRSEETAPWISRLAREGTVFGRAWSTSSWTAPATASLLTGVYPDRHGVTRGFLAQFREGEPVAAEALEDMELLAIATEVPTLAERLRELGYRTLGLASNVNIGPEMEFERGFERFERHDQESARFLRERLLAWVEELGEDDAPRFWYLHFNDVHKPYDLRPRYYRPGEGRAEAEELRARYESELGYLDGFLERIHADLGLGPDALTVLAADHGEEFREHGRLYHDFSLHVELTWVPLVVHGPALRVAPGIAPGNVSLIDVVPTVFELLGLVPKRPLDPDGRSLAELCWAVDKERTALRPELQERPLVQHRHEEGVDLWGIVLGNWKMIRGEEGRRLYDLAEDPGEQQDVADRRPEVVARLDELLERHIARAPAPSSTRTRVRIDEDLLRRLEAAGYVGGDDEDDG